MESADASGWQPETASGCGTSSPPVCLRHWNSRGRRYATAGPFPHGPDEARHLGAGAGEILHVVHALAGAAKETRGAMFGHVAARRDQRPVRLEFAPKAQKLVLVATRAMEQEKQRPARFPGRDGVDVGTDRHCEWRSAPKLPQRYWAR